MISNASRWSVRNNRPTSAGLPNERLISAELESCPPAFDAITLGNEFEISEYSRDDLIYTKDMLLAPPVKRVPVADPDLYDTPIPYYEDHS